MKSSRKEEAAQETAKGTKSAKKGFLDKQAGRPILSSNETNNPVLDQMKTEIRRLYGEKVNMVNTNYMFKPHEFKCIAKSLAKVLWKEEKGIETVDDMIYAVDLLCNQQESKKKEGPEQSIKDKEILTTVRFVASSIRALSSQEEASGFKDISKEESVEPSDLKYLMDSFTYIQNRIETAGHSTVESLIGERDRMKKTISSVTETFSLSPADDIITGLKNMQISKERGYTDALRLKEKSTECERRHYEEKEQIFKEKVLELENENRLLKERLGEREGRAEEVLERGDALEENISQIKKVLAEEERRIEQERQDYRKVKKALIEYNKKMAQIVYELVERIKKEQKERDSLISLDKDLDEI